MFYLQVDGAILVAQIKDVVTTLAMMFIKLTLVAQIKDVVTTLAMMFIKLTLVAHFICTVKPVLRGHDLWDKEKVTL
jgi:ribose/xylose/arabinose/galactoside ABC-type transport system permease subunit